MRPWFREPMLWLVLGLPAAAVIAGFATLFIAVNNGSSDSVRDRVQRTAQVQTADISADLAAEQLGLSGVLERTADTGALSLRVEGTALEAARLQLVMSHPTDAAADLEVRLVRNDGRWIGRLPDPAAKNDWLLSVAPEGAAWRLRGRLRAGATEAALVPDIARR
jgi:hypothetical protein